jgi:uncharacterized protein
MIEPLDPAEVRVLGCLMEKAVTTPDVYPLTLNSLVAACNQTTNRYPVVRYEAADVEAALSSLRSKGITRIVHSPSNRAVKYRHVAEDVLDLDPDDAAVLCVLLLRGPQTLGEIKGRTERLHAFADLDETQATIDAMAARVEPLVVALPRRPGQKDGRYAHLLGGPVDITEEPEPEPVRLAASPLADRVGALEQEVARLRDIVDRLAPLLDD